MKWWVSVALLTVILAACAAPAPAVYTCPSFPTSCEAYRLGVVSSDPTEPFEPTCPVLGEFRDQLDFQLCRCEFEQYVGQLFDRAACISERRAQMATAIYNEMARVYNCRLSEEGCAPVSGISSVSLSSILHPYMDRKPDLPSCTTFLTGHRFYDEFEAQSCRFEVEELRDGLTRWAKRMAQKAQTDVQFAADRAIERFNCHAQGGQYCF